MSSEDHKILSWFMEEKEYVCPVCRTKLLSTFDEEGCACPSCGEKMVEQGKLERIYICPCCGYMTWVVPEEGEIPLCDTCGAELGDTKYTTRDRLTRGGSSVI